MPSNGGNKLNYGPVHNNSNLTCAFDIRVGGVEPHQSDLLEIAILPMDHSYNIHKQFKLFQIKLRPSWPVNLKVAGLSSTSVEEHKTSPHDQISAMGLFERWIETLELKHNKKIIPLVWDWAEVKPYLQIWMGDLSFAHYISENHRELKSIVNFINDRSDVWGEEVPFKSASLNQFLTRTETELIERNSCTANCYAMIQAYKKTLHGFIPGYK